MKVDFYFDPACPWCWVTSRWLTDVSTQRDITINWQPFSLAVKNDELGKNENVSTEVLVRICKALNCEINDIMDLVDDTPQDKSTV